MARIFNVKFRCGARVPIIEYIRFEPDQVEEIKAIAAEYTKNQLRYIEPEGVDLSYLTPDQEQTVIRIKERIIASRTADELHKQNIVNISIHSIERILERRGSSELAVIISLIDKIIDCDSVMKAQFKGFPQLSYTLYDSTDIEEYILPVSFKLKQDGKGGFMKLITVAFKGAAPSKMSTKIASNPELMGKMDDFKRRLVEQSRKNENENG